jgi:nuclear pore complex protein Nup62
MILRWMGNISKMCALRIYVCDNVGVHTCVCTSVHMHWYKCLCFSVCMLYVYMHVYVCLHVCVSLCVYAWCKCICVCLYMCLYVCICVYVCICISQCVYGVSVYMYVCVLVYMYLSIKQCLYLHQCVCWSLFLLVASKCNCLRDSGTMT